MGVIYTAHDPHLERDVALKLLRPDSGTRDKSLARARLLREAQSLAQLAHPNVVSVYDLGIVDEDVFVAMELIEGLTLKAWLGQEDRHWREVLAIFVRAGRGLAAAHAAGLIHRDFKPDNVLIGEDGRVRVVDFGLAAEVGRGELTDSAEIDELGSSEDSLLSSQSGSTPSVTVASSKFHDSLTQTGTVMGTPAYMAPEQHLAQTIDERTDLYCFCVALFEGLYAQRPFGKRKRDMARLTADKLQENIRAPSGDIDVPRRVHRIVVRGLRAKREERWQSMDELLRALSSFLAPGRRKRFAAVMAAIAIAGAATAYAIHDGREARDLEALCGVGAQRFVGIWDEPAKTQARAGLRASGAAFAEATWGLVEPAIDEYVQEWVDGYSDACAATHVHATQSAQLLDLRMACLEIRRRQVGALVELFSESDTGTVEHAVDAVTGLPRIELCADTERLLLRTKLPDDPTMRKQVRVLRQGLARVEALGRAKKHVVAIELAREAVRAAAAIDYLPIQAEAQFDLGSLYRDNDRLAEARTTLDAAVFAAESSGHDEIAAKALLLLAMVGDDRLSFARRAEAAVNRFGDDDLRMDLEDALAHHYYVQGDYQQSVEHMERSVAMAETRYGPDHKVTALARGHLGNVLFELGQYRRAVELQREAVRIRMRAEGAEHPGTATMRTFLAYALIEQAAHEESLEHSRAALAVLERSFGPRNGTAVFARKLIGSALLGQGQVDEAGRVLEETLRATEELYGADHIAVADVVQLLGQVALSRDDLPSAEAGFRRALSILTAIRPEHPARVGPLIELGKVRLRQGKLAEAEKEFLQALALAEAGLGPGHPKVGGALLGLGEVHAGRGQCARAAQLYERGLAIVASSLGEEHPLVAVLLTASAHCALATGHAAAALQQAERALRILEPGGHSRRIARAQFELARALTATAGDAGRARELAKSALAALLVAPGAADEAAAIRRWLRMH